MRLAAGVVVALVCLLVSAPAGAVGDADLEWWTIETDHFRIHYPHPLEPVAERLATLAETIHRRLSADLAYEPSGRTEILITDDIDGANGAATATPYNAIRLYAQAPPDISALGDYDDWYLTLLTHEYTHTLHIDNVSGIPNVLNKIIGKQLTPNSAQPRWIIEGLATVYESAHTSGGRVRSSLFDMFLRADVLADNVARLDQISSNAERYPQGNLFYLYGSKFLRWIMDVYGQDTMTAVSADYGASVVPFAINRAIRRVTGRTYEELYDAWTAHLETQYAAQIKEVEARGLREGRRLTFHGHTAFYPRFVPQAAGSGASGGEIIYYRESGHDRPGLYRIALTADEASGDGELVARTQGVSVPTFTPSGDLVFNSTAFWKNVYARNDLYRLPRGERAPEGDEVELERLTTGLRAMEADVSPSGRQIVFTVRALGTSYLQIADVDPEGHLHGRRDLVASEEFDQAFTPKFSPNGRYVAYSVWRHGGYRDIRLVEVATGHYINLTNDRSVDMHPEWSPDGKTLFFSSDRTGIFNVYALDVEARTLAQVTNVRTGALCPAVSPDGKRLVYSGYTTAGYDLYVMDLVPARYLAAKPPPNDRPDVPPEPEPVAMERRHYNPLPTLAPRAYTVEVKEGVYGANAFTIRVEGADIASHHAFAAQVTTEPDAPSPRFSVEYVYGRLPVNLQARFLYTMIPRGGLIVDGREVRFDERTVALTTGVSYPLNLPFSSHGFSLAYSASVFSYERPEEAAEFEPYSRRTIVPPRGLMGTFSGGYSYSSIEGSEKTPGPSRGTLFRVGVDLADETTGSDYSLQSFTYNLQTYLGMPWPGYHVLMLRNTGGVSGGTYPRRGLFYVGGQDLTQTSVIDVLTGGVFDSGFTLRGYEPSSYIGDEFLLSTAEYRFPLLAPDAGPSTLPVYLRRIDGTVFVDYGGAFDELRLDEIQLFHDSSLVDSPDLHAAVGSELWVGVTVAHRVDARLRFGYAYGFSRDAIPGGQTYFSGSGTF